MHRARPPLAVAVRLALGLFVAPALADGDERTHETEVVDPTTVTIRVFVLEELNTRPG
jgi:hypothetical protein